MPTSCSTSRIVVARRRAAPRSARRAAAFAGAQSGGGLVEQQQPRRPRQGAGQLQPAAAGRAAAPSAGRDAPSRARPTRSRHASACARISRSSRRCCGGRSAAASEAGPGAACAPTMTFSSTVMPREQPGALEHDRDAEPRPDVWRQPVDAAPVEADRPASRPRWPAIRLNSVDLPAPLGPMTPRSSPSATSRSDVAVRRRRRRSASTGRSMSACVPSRGFGDRWNPVPGRLRPARHRSVRQVGLQLLEGVRRGLQLAVL